MTIMTSMNEQKIQGRIFINMKGRHKFAFSIASWCIASLRMMTPEYLNG